MHSGIDALTSGKTGTIYKDLIEGEGYTCPHQFVKSIYDKYSKNYESNSSINGKIFEYLICETLAQQKVTPFYYQATFEYVPNADFDILLYHPQKPVVLTMKVSLRERYEQAEFGGAKLKKAYREADSYLITLSEKEKNNVKNKIESGAVVGLTNVVLASSAEYDDLLDKLAKKEFYAAELINPLPQGKLLRR